MCWIPSHVNIRSNEGADLQPNQLSLPIASMKISADKLIPGIFEFCKNEWQDVWDCCQGNKLHSVYPNVGTVTHSLYPNVGTVTHSKSLSCYDAVLINRL